MPPGSLPGLRWSKSHTELLADGVCGVSGSFWNTCLVFSPFLEGDVSRGSGTTALASGSMTRPCSGGSPCATPSSAPNRGRKGHGPTQRWAVRTVSPWAWQHSEPRVSRALTFSPGNGVLLGTTFLQEARISKKQLNPEKALRLSRAGSSWCEAVPCPGSRPPMLGRPHWPPGTVCDRWALALPRSGSQSRVASVQKKQLFVSLGLCPALCPHAPGSAWTLLVV